MGVGVSQPWSATALWTFSDMGISANEVAWTSCMVLVKVFRFLSLVGQQPPQ
jgi:hypothetical protein